MAVTVVKLERPNAGGSCKAYGSIKRMKKGAEFQGKYLSTNTRPSPRNPAETQTTHYFEATKSGTFEDANGDDQSFSSGDQVGINGTAILNDYVGMLKAGQEVIIKKIGAEKTKNGNTLQLIEVSLVSRSAADAESLD